jgi:hypothetical protein
MTRYLCFSILLVLFLAACETGAAQQAIVTMTPESVDEATRLAADEKATARLLDAYVVQTRAGWGNGPLIGSFSTPFARVVQVARVARKKGRALAAADLTPDLITPELHVIALAQPAATDDGMVATVLSVVVGRRGSKGPADVIQPLKTTELTAQYQNLVGTNFKGTGVVAVFPLSALVPDSEIRVVFDRTARGFFGLSMCRESTVPVSVNRIR